MNLMPKDLDTIENNPRSITQPRQSPVTQQKFSWVAFIVMVISIGIVLLVGMLFPGILDEFIAVIIVNLIYGFAQKHGFKIPNK